jgi:cobalt-zinc-cadmium efflux system protein
VSGNGLVFKERLEMAHVHGKPAAGRYLGLSLGLTLLFVVAEAAAGYFANSLALLSDAGHNFADALALLFSWYAVRVARRPADARRTYGYHRVGVLAALANALSLGVIAGFIAWEAVQRLRFPEPVEGGLMIGVALAAVLLNGTISLWLHAEARHDLNIRSAYLHMLGDALSAVGVVVAGVVVALTGKSAADPVVSLLIAALILWSSWGVLSEAVHVLLEAVPKGVEVARVVSAIRQVPGVEGVHDLHVWTIGSGMAACSCHVVVNHELTREGQRVHQAVAEVLRHEFGIGHTTVQVEIDACGAGEMHCTMQPAHHHHAGHAHGGHEH